MTKAKVVVFDPGCAPEVRELPASSDGITLEALQGAVGGYIEVVILSRLAPDMGAPDWALLICDEDGIAKDRVTQFHRLGIRGTFVVCKDDWLNGDRITVGLSDDEVRQILDLRWRPWTTMR